MAAFGVAGLVSAGEIGTQTQSKKISNIYDVKTFKALKNEMKIENQLRFKRQHNWIAIDSGCGQQYFLDLNHYSDDLAGLIAFQNDIAFFSEQKCRGASASAPIGGFA